MKKPNLDTIENLLADVREQFVFLKNTGTEADPLDVELFEATVNFLAANVGVYRKSFVSDQSAAAEQETGTVSAGAPVTGTVSEQLSVEEPVFVPDPFTGAAAPVNEEPVPTEEPVFEDRPVNVEDPVIAPAAEDDDTVESGLWEEDPGPVGFAPEEENPVLESDTWDPDIWNKEAAAEEEEEPLTPGEEPVLIELEPASGPELFTWEKEPEPIERETPVQPQQRPLSINEILAKQRKENAAAAGHMDGGRITDLKAAISLNDKLLFIKDLFNGYSLAYSEAIELLNRYDSFEEADAFLQTNYAVKNQWPSKQETVDKLYSILRRRY